MTTFNELGSSTFKVERIKRTIPRETDTIDLSDTGSVTLTIQTEKLDELIDLLTKARELFGLEKKVNSYVSRPPLSREVSDIYVSSQPPKARFDGGINGPSRP